MRSRLQSGWTRLHALRGHPRTAPSLCPVVREVVRRNIESQHRDTTAYRFQRRHPARDACLCQPRRTSAGAQSGVSHLHLIEQDSRCRSGELQPERRKRLDARLRRAGTNGHEPREADVDQLSQHAHRSQRHPRTILEVGRLCPPQGHRHRERQPLQLHPERTPHQHPQHPRRQGVLHRVQLHEQEPQHAGLAYRHACL